MTKFKLYLDNGDIISYGVDYYFVFRFQWLEIRKYPDKYLAVCYHSERIKKIVCLKDGKEI